MPGTIVPAQMFDHELNPTKGWPSPYAVDKALQPNSGVTAIFAGTGVTIDPSTGKLALGFSVAGAMAMFAFQNQNDFDVNGDVGNIISNHINCLVACGSYELETTEYIGSSFTSQTPLTLDASTGKVKAASGGITGANDVCGVVSDASPILNAYGKNVVRFWPVYAPKRS